MVLKLEYSSISYKLYELFYIGKEMKNELEHLEETIEDLGIFWDSDASGEYAMRITADLYNSKALLKRIAYSIKQLSDILIRFNEAEHRVQSVIEDIC